VSSEREDPSGLDKLVDLSRGFPQLGYRHPFDIEQAKPNQVSTEPSPKEKPQTHVEDEYRWGFFSAVNEFIFGRRRK
jgi:hypothetical protein